MRVRLTTIIAAAGIAAAVVPAGAATSPATTGPAPQISDPVGDANGVNDQGSGSGVDTSLSAPVDDANGDITSVVFQTKFKLVTTTKKVTTVVKKRRVTKTIVVTTKVPDGFTVTMNLSAAPDGNHAYDVFATNSTCDGSLDFTYSTGPLGLNEVDCVGNFDPTNPTSLLDISTVSGEAAVVGKSVVWTIPAGAFPVGGTFTDLSAQTELSPTLDPVMDEAKGTATYKVGQ